MEIGSKQWKQLIAGGAESFGIHIRPNKIGQFAVYAAELMRWNQSINLTAITNPKDIAVKHFIDSIIPSLYIPQEAKLLDIGSGGGFPGIPLKILSPLLSVTLIDASRKKVSFLKHVIRTLKLENIEARHMRATDLCQQNSVSSRFDVIISRALASIEKYVKMAVPLLAKDGVIIAMKGAKPFQEPASARSRVDKNGILMEIENVKYVVTLKTYTLPYQKSQKSLLTIKPGGCDEDYKT